MAKRRMRARAREIIKKERGLKREEERILRMERHIQQEERRILKEEEHILEQEQEIEKKEDALMEKESEILGIEDSIVKEVEDIPLQRLSMRDVYKAFVGAFFGIVAHFAFVEGAHVAEQISLQRASVILLVSFLLGYLLIDKSGFKKVREQRLLRFIPLRVTVIYLVSLVVIFSIFILFNQVHMDNLSETYKHIAVTSILAMLGAASADMIGHDHE